LLGIDGEKIENVVVVSGESLLGFIDTYTITFTTNNINTNTVQPLNINNLIPSPNIAKVATSNFSKN
jgi:hypothetical protein